MTTKKRVGRSTSHTPLKHKFLNAELGRIVGVLQKRIPAVFAVEPIIIVDYCAGDGEESVESPDSSPAIIVKHSHFKDLKSEVYLCEKSPHTFKLLQDNYGSLATCLNIDSSEFNLTEKLTVPNQAVFLFADPNNVEQLPVNDNFINALTPTTTMLLTLGCNVGGLKRLTEEGRRKWFDKVIPILKLSPKWHDVQLIVLNNDNSQWAYLLTTPTKWQHETIYKLQKIGDKEWIQGVSIYSRNLDGEKIFVNALKQLFLTKKENSCETI
jgi:hypothetical protein